MENTLNENNPQSIVTVSELNRTARTLLERGIARLWVEGEISNLAKPPSGHLYFSLKDDFAQISCVYFRQKQRQSDITIENDLAGSLEIQKYYNTYMYRGYKVIYPSPPSANNNSHLLKLNDFGALFANEIVHVIDFVYQLSKQIMYRFSKN